MYKTEDIEILKRLRYSEDNIMNVHRFEEGHIVKEFFNFIWRDIAQPSNPFRVEPFSAFLMRDNIPNAWAACIGGRNIITFHTGLISLLDNAIHQKVPNELAPGDNLKWALEGYFRQSLPSFMFQMVSIFIYYHELAHLNQQKFKNSSNSLFSEVYDLSKGEEFKQESHAMEIDADIFAAIQVALLLFEYWSKIPEQKREASQLSAMVSSVSGGIFLFWYTMQGGWRDLYFLDHSHPHVLMRTYCIFDCMTSTLHGVGGVGKPFDSIECQRNTFWVVSQLLEEPTSNGLRDFWTLFEQNVEAMEEYFQRYMTPISKGLPYLVQWNWPGRAKKK